MRYDGLKSCGTILNLWLPHKVVAGEADGLVKFGMSDKSAYLFDPYIYTNGRISVQAIDAVLFPPDETVPPAMRLLPDDKKPPDVIVKKKHKRGRILEAACSVMTSLSFCQ